MCPVDDGVDFPVTCCGTDCNVELAKKDQYPKGDKWGDDESVWCETCWNLRSQEMVTAEIADPDTRAEKLRELERAQKRPADQGESVTAKRRKLNKCKWCNSTTHKTK